MHHLTFHRALAVCLLILAIFVLCANAQEKKKLTFDQIFKNAEPKLIKSLPSINGWSDDDHYLESKKKATDEKEKLYSIDVKSGSEELYRNLDQYRSIIDTTIDPNTPVSHTEKYDKLIYSKEKDLYFFNTITNEFKRLTQTASEEKNPTLSPDGNYVAFTRDNNLFAIDIETGKEFQYTNDESDVVYNGWAAWLYYEEIFGRPSHYRAFWWSPDGKHLAFFRFDESKVPVFPIFNAEGVHGSLENTRYPKAGDPNPEVKLGVIAIPESKIVWVDFNEKSDQYFGTPDWTPDGKQLIVQWMNRGQDNLKIYSVNINDGRKKEIYDEKQTAWIELEYKDRIRFLERYPGFIIKSDKDGWTHLYHYSMDGKLINKITNGEWSVADLALVDEDEGIIYFTARKEISTNTDLYRVNLNGKNLKRLTSGDYTHSINISPSGKYFIDTYSNVSIPSTMKLYTTDGKLVRELGNSKTDEFEKYELAIPKIFHVRTSDGINLPVIWTLPSKFDESKKHPVLIEVYGGPDTYDVSNSWKRLRSQWLAMEGIIQVTMDHRGSAHFGKNGTALMHRQLGKWEMNDYIEVVKWLRGKPFVDTTKICITGGSYGGYVTCMALTYGADYFTHGIADYSVTDFRLYDSHYTERFMDTPEENPEGYKNTSTITYADRYKGMLYIIHGTMDDNVHMQNILQLIDKLQDLKKHFELMIYPGGRHGWGGPKATHLRNETYRFYYKHLLEKDFPVNLFN
jgi:dipeptidyl-peptidase-4